MIEQIRCSCHHKNVLAERDEQGVYIKCKGCREKYDIANLINSRFIDELSEIEKQLKKTIEKYSVAVRG